MARLASLDGLRGLAAVLVVLHHVAYIVLSVADGSGDTDVLASPAVQSVMVLLLYLGEPAVWLFFGLSGLVLTRSFRATTVHEYGAYLAARVIRLYLPVWAAVLVTVGSMLVIARDPSGLGAWVARHPEEIRASAVLRDLTLVFGTGVNLPPLWSLQWEVIFSVALIAYVTVARKLGAVASAVAFGALGVFGTVVGVPALAYLPIFGIGVALALM